MRRPSVAVVSILRRRQTPTTIGLDQLLSWRYFVFFIFCFCRRVHRPPRQCSVFHTSGCVFPRRLRRYRSRVNPCALSARTTVVSHTVHFLGRVRRRANVDVSDTFPAGHVNGTDAKTFRGKRTICRRGGRSMMLPGAAARSSQTPMNTNNNNGANT